MIMIRKKLFQSKQTVMQIFMIVNANNSDK